MKSGNKINKAFLTTLLALIAMLIVACEGGSGPSNDTPTSTPMKAHTAQQILNLPLSVSDIQTFDPGQVSDQPSAQVIAAIFTGLVQLNDQLQVTSQMTTSWTSSPDHMTWTFTLKSGLKFSDGTPLTSADIVYSIDRVLSPQIANLSGDALTYLGLIKDSGKRTAGEIPSLIDDSLLTPDSNTVVIKLNQASPYFLQALSYPISYIVEKKIIAKWGLKWTDHLTDNGGQGGAGPFMVSSYDHTKGIDLVPNPYYYGPRPQLMKLNFFFYASPKTQYEVYQAGQLDETAIPTVNYAQASMRSDFSKNPDLMISYYSMNYLIKPFDNIHIRQAFELAINKDVLVQTIYNGRMIPTCHIVPLGMPGYNPNLQCPGGGTTSGDATKARELFKQGLREENLTSATLPTIKITYLNGNPEQDQEIRVVRLMWQQILGVNVQPNPIDFNILLVDLDNTINNPKGLQMWAIAWIAEFTDPRDMTILQFGQGSPYNSSNYGQNKSSDAVQQQQVQKQLEQADMNYDSKARFQMYNLAEQQLVDDVAWSPLWQNETARLLKPYVIGRVYNDLELVPPDDWAKVYIAAH